jgi:hypothetical protein
VLVPVDLDPVRGGRALGQNRDDRGSDRVHDGRNPYERRLRTEEPARVHVDEADVGDDEDHGVLRGHQDARRGHPSSSASPSRKFQPLPVLARILPRFDPERHPIISLADQPRI